MNATGVPATPAIEQLRSAARACAGDDLCEIDGDRTLFLWLYGSTMIEASLEPDGGILLRAYLVLGPLRRGLAPADLALEAPRVSQGEITVDDDGDVVLVRRLPPHTGAIALLSVVQDFALLADDLDDRLHEELGGVLAVQRFHDDVLDVLRRGEPRPAPLSASRAKAGSSARC